MDRDRQGAVAGSIRLHDAQERSRLQETGGSRDRKNDGVRRSGSGLPEMVHVADSTQGREPQFPDERRHGEAVHAPERQGIRLMIPRRSLFRKYLIIFVLLVGGSLLASGLTGLYFAYHESRNALINLQREKAE